MSPVRIELAQLYHAYNMYQYDQIHLVGTESDINLDDVINVHVMLRFAFRLAAVRHMQYSDCKASS
jgi:hypothetical protein